MIEERINVREHLLATINWFVPQAAKLAGVRRIALLGSITTAKKDPKDIDFLVTIEDDADLELLARLGRQVKGTAQHINHGADILSCECSRRLHRTNLRVQGVQASCCV